MFERIVESLIREAQDRGEFDNLLGKGKPIDLSAYFDTPEEVRLAYSMLKSAGITPREVNLLNEIAQLKQMASALHDEKKKAEIQMQIAHKQTEFNLLMERARRQSKRK